MLVTVCIYVTFDSGNLASAMYGWLRLFAWKGLYVAEIFSNIHSSDETRLSPWITFQQVVSKTFEQGFAEYQF